MSVDHYMPTLIITMTTSLNENADNESWGIRDFQLLITPCPSGCKICSADIQKGCQAWEFGASDWMETSNLQAEGWQVENAKAGTTSCSGVDIFGGFGLFGKGAKITKTFSLPVHNSILIRLQFWKIDSWDNEYARVYVDGYLLWNA